MNVRQNQVPTSEFRPPNSASSRRRGVTLLFVISMIVLFLLMGTTFVVVSNDYLRAAKRRNASGGVNAGAVTREEGQQLVMQSFLEAVRGPSLDNESNPLRGHDLLGDMYGFGIEATIDGVPQTYGGATPNDTPFLVVTLSASPPDTVNLLTGAREDLTRIPNSIPGHYAGQVLTFVTGDFQGLTARIIQHLPLGVTGGGGDTDLIIHPLGGTHDLSGPLDDMADAKVIINGKAFAGTGAGRFDSTVAVDEAAFDASAQSPNRVQQDRGDMQEEYFVRAVPGAEVPNSQSTNEPWDAFDFQNMALARLVDVSGDDVLNDNDMEVSPSFGGVRDGVAEHTSFKAFAALGPRHVDNDNDGINDGIWIDTGMQVRSTPDGEYIKPVVSFLILDMDGRLNINAHGNSRDSLVIDTTDVYGPPITPAQFPQGLGFGPAEISLAPVLQSQPNATLLLEARYANRNQLNAESFAGLDGFDDRSRYRFAGYPDGLAANGTIDDGLLGNHFSSPFDLNGRAGLGFFKSFPTATEWFEATMPAVALAPDAAVNTVVNSPYEVDLLGSGESNDSIFTVDELERVLRPGDRDSALLNARLDGDESDANTVLHDVLGSGGTLTDDEKLFLRKLLTTHSYEVPAIPEDINRLLYDALTTAGGLTDAAQIASVMGELLSPEVRRGLPMNINRIFGDGRDPDGDEVVDEPDEVEDFVVGIDGSDIKLDVDNNGVDDDTETDSGYFARVNFARRLFVLAILLTENPSRNGAINAATDFFDFDGSDNGGTAAEEDIVAHRRMLAQWCVNVVDFRDPDSIMTGMEFDLNPFDGWEVDGDLATDEGMAGGFTSPNFGATAEPNYFVAWGMERPELLITETIALHDVRTEDLATEANPSQNTASKTTDTTDKDEDYDSRLVPNASAFFELYNPWIVPPGSSTGTGALQPQEIYRGTTGIELAARDAADDDYPVWRLVVFDPDSAAPNPRVRDNTERLDAEDVRDDPMIEQLVDDAIADANNSPALVRIAYFVQPTGAASGQPQFDGNKVYFPAGNGIDGSILEPGGYAVIGSAGQESGGAFTTYIGRTNTDATLGTVNPTDLANTQRFVLDPSSESFTTQDAGGETTPVSNIVAIALNENGTGTPRSFGITDPVAGYAAAANAEFGGADVQAIDDGFQFIDGGGAPLTIDRPIDQAVFDDDTEWANHPLNHRGLISGYRVVYLQRLANPEIPFNAQTNPYRIVDSSAIDLFVFNGLVPQSVETSAAIMPAVVESPHSEDALSSYERTEQNSPNARERRRLWRTGVLGDVDPASGTPLTGQVVGFELENSFGERNDFYSDATINAGDANPFPWLAWNNRPFANRYELVNVPYTSAHWLTRVFDVRGAGIGDTYSAKNHDAFSENPLSDSLRGIIHPNAAAFPHLLNFEADAVTGGSIESDRMHQVFDFVEVPSRFASVDEYVETPASGVLNNAAALADFGYRLSPPFDELSTYRYPGKVNLNTISSASVWDALLGAKDTGGGIMLGPYASAFDFAAWRAALGDSPVRPAVAANYVATGGAVPGTANVGLFRSGIDSNRTPGTSGNLSDETDYRLSYHQVVNPFNNTDRNSYFRNGLRQRLGGVATNRSSVFAIWVTVGYFEWDNETNDFRMNGPNPIEYGTETGTVQRSRGFFMFDRSIPMAYEPGVDHNIDRGILLQSLIE